MPTRAAIVGAETRSVRNPAGTSTCRSAPSSSRKPTLYGSATTYSASILLSGRRKQRLHLPFQHERCQVREVRDLLPRLLRIGVRHRDDIRLFPFWREMSILRRLPRPTTRISAAEPAGPGGRVSAFRSIPTRHFDCAPHPLPSFRPERRSRGAEKSTPCCAPPPAPLFGAGGAPHGFLRYAPDLDPGLRSK